MLATVSQLKTPAPVTFTVTRGNRQVKLTYQQLFASGHALWLEEKYGKAAEIFRHLTKVTDRGPRAHVMLAHCQAMCGDFAGCDATLADALPDLEYGTAHADLQDTFVLWRLKMYVEVRQSLEKFIDDHPELPTPCLLLADLLHHLGNRIRPPRLLQQAIDRDRRNGAIALIARHELSAMQFKSTEAGPDQANSKLPSRRKMI